MTALHLTLRQLQIFVAVAESGSTTAASAEIALSQSATSAAVQELERLLDLRLFERVGKRLQLNEQGRSLLPRARAVLDAANAVARFAQAPEAARQSVRIGASLTVADHMLPRVLTAFLGDLPAQAEHWHSQVSVGNTAHICAQVASFALDIGLIEGPSHEPLLIAQPWLEDDMVIAGSPALVARLLTQSQSQAPEGSISLPVLREAVWLLREPGSGTREVADQALYPALGAYRRHIELGGNESIRQAAAAGLGLACLSRRVVQAALAAGTLVAPPTPLPRISRTWYWVLHRERQITPALETLIHLLPHLAEDIDHPHMRVAEDMDAGSHQR